MSPVTRQLLLGHPISLLWRRGDSVLQTAAEPAELFLHAGRLGKLAPKLVLGNCGPWEGYSMLRLTGLVRMIQRRPEICGMIQQRG